MFAQSNFDEAKYLTLGVGAVNVAFTIVAVSILFCFVTIFIWSYVLLVMIIIHPKDPYNWESLFKLI